jgi:hypothetical protein
MKRSGAVNSIELSIQFFFIPHAAALIPAFIPLLDMQVRGVLHRRTIPVRFPKLLCF